MKTILALMCLLIFTGCDWEPTTDEQDHAVVEQQQGIYQRTQPIPQFEYSLERAAAIELYTARLRQTQTHSVWRSDTGVIEGDCLAVGFPLPYDMSLTNPFQPVTVRTSVGVAVATIEQPEPNGLYASHNSNATWVRCVLENGTVTPVSVESRVTTYAYPVLVDYDTNRVTRIEGRSPSIQLTTNSD